MTYGAYRQQTGQERTSKSASPPGHHVRHAFWKYPIIAVCLGGLLLTVAGFAGSPNWPRTTISGAATMDPGGATLAFTQELDGTSASWTSSREYGMGSPDDDFVIGPLMEFQPWLAQDTKDALRAWNLSSPSQRQMWAANYDKALASITPMSGSSGMAQMTAVASPDVMKVAMLHGDFGPVPVLVDSALKLAQEGHLDHYLLALNPGHSLHLQTIWLYDNPTMLNQAVANGLTDDQWGMVKERGFPVGPWYLIIPSIIHVKLPGGSNGTGFVLWNFAFMTVFMLAVPLLPGVRSIPQKLKLYRFMYRYPSLSERAKLAGDPREPGPSRALEDVVS